MSAIMKKKRRNVISHDTKVGVLKRLNEGLSLSAVAKQFGIGKSTAHDIKKLGDGMHVRVTKSKRKNESNNVVWIQPKTAEMKLEEAVYKWHLKDVAAGRESAEADICFVAERLAECIGLPNFSASNGWFCRFKKRFGIEGGTTQGEGGVNRQVYTEIPDKFAPEASKGFKDSSEFGADFPLAGGQPSENEASQKVSSDEIYIKEEDFTSSNESFLLSETPNPGIEEIDTLKMEVMDEEITDESFSLKQTSSGASEQWSKSDETNFAEAGLVMGTNYSSNEAPVPSVPHAPPVQVSTTFIRGGRIAQNNNPASFPPVSSPTCNLLPKQNLPKNNLPIEELNEPGDYGVFVNSLVTEMDLKQQVLAKFYIFKILDLGKNGKLTPMGVTL